MNDRPKHSPIGASSRYRWAKCPGSVNLSKDEPNVAGAAAIEGTLAHEVVAHVLNTATSKNMTPGEAMTEYFQVLAVYLDYCYELKKRCKPEHIHIEHGFDMGKIFPNLYGTADYVAFEQSASTLHVVDYKNGIGLVVEPENNEQLEYYGLGALTTLNYACRWVKMTIVQPRAYHPNGAIRSWTVPSLHFIDVENKIIAEAKRTLKKKALIAAGGHCMFCPAKKKCEVYKNSNAKNAKKEFSFYEDPKLDFQPVV